MNKQFNQAVNRVLKRLQVVEHRSWDMLLLDSTNHIQPVSELRKLASIAECYELFVAKYKMTTLDHKLEAYKVLQAAFNGVVFPHRVFLSREQFEFLLDLHLERVDV